MKTLAQEVSTFEFPNLFLLHLQFSSYSFARILSNSSVVKNENLYFANENP